jgi:hypothetical protein
MGNKKAVVLTFSQGTQVPLLETYTPRLFAIRECLNVVVALATCNQARSPSIAIRTLQATMENQLPHGNDVTI